MIFNDNTIIKLMWISVVSMMLMSTINLIRHLYYSLFYNHDVMNIIISLILFMMCYGVSIFWLWLNLQYKK
mgnify:CR=1 FL=1